MDGPWQTLVRSWTYFFSFPLYFLQNIEYSSLHCAAGPCCSPTLFVESYVCSPQPPTTSLPQTLPPWQTSVCSLCSWFCFIDEFIWVTFQVPYMNNVIWYLSFSFRIPSLSVIISSCTHVAANGVILSFYGWVVLHCMCIPHPLYPVIWQWIVRLFPCLGYGK